MNENSDTQNVVRPPDFTAAFTADLVATARRFALRCHDETNHRYDEHPYSTHLQLVFDYGCQFAHLLPDEAAAEAALAACWTHDTIEDCRQTYNDVQAACGPVVAEITYALTNEKGRNRKERANERYYAGIRQTPLAAFVKVCDRLANARYSQSRGNRMLAVYRQEAAHFEAMLYSEELKPLFDELAELLVTPPPSPLPSGRGGTRF